MKAWWRGQDNMQYSEEGEQSAQMFRGKAKHVENDVETRTNQWTDRARSMAAGS